MSVFYVVAALALLALVSWNMGEARKGNYISGRRLAFTLLVMLLLLVVFFVLNSNWKV